MPHSGIAMHEYIVGEVASLAAVLGALVGVLPSIATIFAILWYSILLYDRLLSRRFRRVPAVQLDTDRKDS